jgi:hypothetical protein
MLAALHYPGWAEWGIEPDVSALHAEDGAGFRESRASGEVDEWDWQRDVPLMLVNGRTRVFHYLGRGHLESPLRMGFTDHVANGS